MSQAIAWQRQCPGDRRPPTWLNTVPQKSPRKHRDTLSPSPPLVLSPWHQPVPPGDPRPGSPREEGDAGTVGGTGHGVDALTRADVEHGQGGKRPRDVPAGGHVPQLLRVAVDAGVVDQLDAGGEGGTTGCCAPRSHPPSSAEGAGGWSSQHWGLSAPHPWACAPSLGSSLPLLSPAKAVAEVNQLLCSSPCLQGSLGGTEVGGEEEEGWAALGDGGTQAPSPP